jgi:hypothetical protein
VPRPAPLPGAEVCDDLAVAAGRVGAGADVVVLLPEGVVLPAGPRGPGRVAVFVTTAGGDTDRAEAAAMGAELFGA